MTDAEWLAAWAAHLTPCALFVISGQYVFMPLLRERCDDCGLLH